MGAAEAQNDAATAKQFLQAALKAAESGNLKEERKEIRRKMDALG